MDKLKNLILCAVCSAILCIFSVMTIPIGAIPITLGTFGIMLVAVILGAKRSVISVAIFILLGAVGLPVFSGFRGGFMVIAGPTGGYIIGYILMALIIGLSNLINSKNTVLMIVYTVALCIAGAIADYILGTAQFMIVQKTGLWTALTACVFPFAVIDFIKCIAASIIGIYVRRGLQKAHLL